LDKEFDERLSGLTIPRHVAVIMDGNGRWAEERGLSHLAGHAAGREATKRLVDAAGRFGIDVVSVYAFSTENWRRSENEVSGLMELIEGALRHEMAELRRQKVRVVASGRLRQLPASLQKLLADTAKATADYERLTLNLCINYGGRAEIADAARTIAVAAAAGELDPADIDTDTFADYLYQPDLPDPDLLIRTSGELRLSNFLLYQMAYTEMVVLPIYWPDFDAASLIDAIEQYNGRERRYGQRKS
jgi:undecaprenyl diphosphate synthase